MFEVEKKFKVPSNFKSVLIDQGWKYLGEIHFTDTYFDSENYDLINSDHWLRQRDGKLQLKCPASSESECSSVKIDQYIEIEDKLRIIDRLAFVLKAENCGLVDKTTNNVVEVLGLKPIARFESFRVKYKLDSFTIDLDKTDFDYELGEIEVICKRKGDVEHAKADICDMAEKLGEHAGLPLFFMVWHLGRHLVGKLTR